MTDDFAASIRRFQQRVERLTDVQSISFAELFKDEFMLRNTDYPSMEALIAASGFRLESQADFEAIPDLAWETFIQEHTRFTSWEEMQSSAVEDWMSDRLNGA